MAAGDLHDLALDVLDAAAAILQGESEAAEHIYLSHGPPALDCPDQLTVHITTIGEAATQQTDPLAPGMRKARVNLTGLAVTITRCYPTVDDHGNAPPADELTAASARLNADGWALWNGLWRRRAELFSTCEAVFFDGLAALDAQGGIAGWVMPIRVELGGYAPVEGS